MCCWSNVVLAISLNVGKMFICGSLLKIVETLVLGVVTFEEQNMDKCIV
ncbi:hypothetical protein [Candidatus Hodgkinia cicadicola]